jgi:hypothetical protein
MGFSPDNIHYVNALPPVADAFSGATATSDVINVQGSGGIEFLVYTGVGATGTSTFTVLACDDVTPSNTTAVAFWYKEITSDPGDTTWTLATATGFLRTAGSNAMFRIWVPADLIGATGYGYARLNGAEGTDSPVLGGILAILHNTTFQPNTVTVIT